MKTIIDHVLKLLIFQAMPTICHDLGLDMTFLKYRLVGKFCQKQWGQKMPMFDSITFDKNVIINYTTREEV